MIMHSFFDGKQVRRATNRERIKFHTLKNFDQTKTGVDLLRRAYRIVHSIPSFDDNRGDKNEDEYDDDDEDISRSDSELNLVSDGY